LLINKITTGFVIQVFDTDNKEFISQNFTASDECDYETQDGKPVDSSLLEVDGKEIYLPYDMVHPGIKHIQLFDNASFQIGILKTTADDTILDKLFGEYKNYESDVKGIEDFNSYCCRAYPKHIFERFFLDDEKVLEI